MSTVVSVDGRRFEARLLSIDDSWNFRLETPNRQFVLSLEEVLKWGQFKDAATGPIVVLDDGSMIVAQIDRIERDVIIISSRNWSSARIPTSVVRGVLMNPPVSLHDRDQALNRFLAPPTRRDRIVLRNDDQLEGLVVPTTVDEGESRRRSGIDRVDLQIGAQKVAVSRDRISSIQWARDGGDEISETSPRVMLGFRDGSILACQDFREARDQLELKLACGVELTLRSRFGQMSKWERVVAVQSLQGPVTYLSDIEVAQYEFRSAWGRRWNYQLDRNVLTGRMRSTDGVYTKGLGMHSAASLAFFLDEKYRRLRGEIALDASVESEGSVVYKIFATTDGSSWDVAFESPIVRGGDAPIPIDVDVEGALAITLTVEYADRGAILDRANWLDLHVLP